MDNSKKSIGIVCSDIYMRFPEIMEEEFDDLLEFLKDEHIRCEGATDVFMDLQKENKQLEAQIKEYQKALDETMSEKIDIENNWNKLKEYMINAEQIYKESDDKYVKDMHEMGIRHAYKTILYKMQKLE